MNATGQISLPFGPLTPYKKEVLEVFAAAAEQKMPAEERLMYKKPEQH